MDDPSLDNLDDVILSYTFFRYVEWSCICLLFFRGMLIRHRARRNDKGHAVPDASEEAIQRSQGFDQYEHAPVKTTGASLA